MLLAKSLFVKLARGFPKHFRNLGRIHRCIVMGDVSLMKQKPEVKARAAHGDFNSTLLAFFTDLGEGLSMRAVGPVISIKG